MVMLCKSPLRQANPAPLALPHTTNFRLLPLEGELVFSCEMLLGDPVVNEIPWKHFIEILGSIHEEVWIDLGKPKGL